MLNGDSVSIVLLSVFLLCALGIILVGIWIFNRGKTTKIEGRISGFVEGSRARDGTGKSEKQPFLQSSEVSRFREWLNSTLGGLSSEKLRIKISSAYWSITDTEFILLRILGVILGFLLGWLILRNIFAGILLAAVFFIIPPLMLDRAISLRQQKFQKQLLDVLILIKGAVQAGYSLMQALDLASTEVEAPSSEEFARVIREIRFGLPLEQALNNLADRMESDDLQIVITAIIINSQVGGNLSTVLEAAISTIRDRMHLLGEIRSLTSYARYVGNFLTLMPFITGLAIFVINPKYFDTVKTNLFTQLAMLIALIGIIIGNLVIRSMVRIRV
jgi:tight adherence protein B